MFSAKYGHHISVYSVSLLNENPTGRSLEVFKGCDQLCSFDVHKLQYFALQTVPVLLSEWKMINVVQIGFTVL